MNDVHHPLHGTFTGPFDLGDSTVIPPTGKRFDLLYSTSARWRDGRIVEKFLCYDNGEFLQQTGIA